MQVEFLKVLACVAWADGEVTNTELNFLKQFVRQFDLAGEEWTQVQMYLEEPVDGAEMMRVTRRFLTRVRSPGERRKLVETVDRLVYSDSNLTEQEREWVTNLKEMVAETRGSTFILDGLKSLLRVGGEGSSLGDRGREADVHDFIHNRVLFKLRRRVGFKRLESEGSPEKIKKLTLSAALLARVGYVDESFLPQEEACLKKVLCETWGASARMAEAICAIAVETVTQGVDLHRLVQEVKSTMATVERKKLIEALFALSKAEGKMSNEEIEEIRKVAYGLDFSHKEFIDSKLRVLRK